MPGGADHPPDVLVDTSVAMALSVADHEHHEQVHEALGSRRLGLAGHAAFETFSVLTRLPAPARLVPAAADRLLQANFPAGRHLGPAAAEALLERLVAVGTPGARPTTPWLALPRSSTIFRWPRAIAGCYRPTTLWE